MKIVLVNTNFFMFGGAERYNFDLAKLLEEHGHTVIFFAMQHPHNFPSKYSQYFVSRFPEFNELSLVKKLRYILRFFYNPEARRKFRTLIQKENPDIIHINILSYEISHSIILEAKENGIPIVMTLHDLRLLCPQILFLSRGKTCTKCINGKFYHCICNKCFDGSFLKSFLLTSFYYFNHFVFKIVSKVDLFISPSLFLLNLAKNSFFFKKSRIIQLPHIIDVKNISPSYSFSEKTIVYFGRLSYEKGIEILLMAVKNLDVKVKIIGSGKAEYEQKLQEMIAEKHISNVSFLGFLEQDSLVKEISSAMFTVSPSICQESFGYSLVESFSLGKTVVASDLGAFKEIISDMKTGLLFKVGSSEHLHEKIKFLLENSHFCIEFGKNARKWVEDNLDPDKLYQALVFEYEQLLRHK